MLPARPIGFRSEEYDLRSNGYFINKGILHVVPLRTMKKVAQDTSGWYVFADLDGDITVKGVGATRAAAELAFMDKLKSEVLFGGRREK